MVKINIIVSDRQYAEALALTLARCLNALVSVDGEDDADYVLCDRLPADPMPGYIAVNKFEPVTKIIDEIRSRTLSEDGEPMPDVNAVAVTGTGGAGVSSIALIMARVFSRIQGKRVLFLSLNAWGGLPERFIYEVLAKGKVDVSVLEQDKFGVYGAGESCEKEPSLNPIARLGEAEMSTLLARLGSSDFDVIVMDVPLASPHWSLCMKAAENAVCVGEGKNAELVKHLYSTEVKGMRSIQCFENEREENAPDTYGETGARMRSFVQGIAC